MTTINHSTEKVLIVDDNDKYAKALEVYFHSKNIETDRARTAQEGYEMFHKKQYIAVITDVTMETQTSGLWFARKIYKEGYKGKIIIASTGFDVFGVMFIGKYLLPSFAGVRWMIPKVPLKAGRVEFHPTYLAEKETPF
ncbi:MAG: response regulator [Leptospiraceae bacterium]|nr:response regulator [Leptospiraceae bacterium]